MEVGTGVETGDLSCRSPDKVWRGSVCTTESPGVQVARALTRVVGKGPGTTIVVTGGE